MKAKAYIVYRVMREPELEWSKPKDCLSAEPLYTTPPQSKPLTDEQIKKAAPTYCVDDFLDFNAGVRFAEAHHGIKE